MKRKFYLLSCLSLFAPLWLLAQHTFTSGNSALQISGYVISFYQYRAPLPGSTDLSKSTFMLDDARLELNGYHKGQFKYSLEINFVDIATLAINGIKDIKHNPITEANFQYLNPYVNVKVGYFKVPFSASSLMDKIPSPFLQRTSIADGDYFTRRDAGVLLFKDFWHQRIHVTAGMISGMGEAIMLGVGDPNGQPEFIARVEISNAYYRDEEIDFKDLQRPIFRVAGGVRYSEKTAFSGNGTTVYALDNVKTIDGTKISYGIDAGFMWRGFSAQFEMGHAYMKPHAGNDLAKLVEKYGTNYYKNGGYLVQANYFNKKIWSVFAVRYSEFNPSDLIVGSEQRTLTFGYNLLIKNTHLTVKLHYDYRFNQPNTGIKWKEDQFRGGFQYLF